MRLASSFLGLSGTAAATSSPSPPCKKCMKSCEGKVHCTWVVAIAECSLNSHNFTPYYSNYTALQCRKTVIFQLLSSRSDKERTDFPHTDVFNQIKLVKVGSVEEIFFKHLFCKQFSVGYLWNMEWPILRLTFYYVVLVLYS